MRKREEVQAVLRPLRLCVASVFAAICCCFPASGGQLSEEGWDWDRQFSRLHAIDGLGRGLSSAEECGPLREGKYVGIFYFLWHGAHDPSGPWDLSKILKAETPQFGPPGAFHHWAEPELGYYRSSDPYVFAAHAEMLAAARVDTIVVDVTNGHSYAENLKVLCETWLRIRKLGNPTPQIAFLARTDQGRVVRELFERFYSNEGYEKLWFEWEGKPLMLADPDAMDDELKEFFTFRESWAWTRTKWFGDGRGKWAWLDDTPQQAGLGWDGEVEQISVSVAQHATSNKGRSFAGGIQPDAEQQRPDAGIYFAEQWDRALEVDPRFVFVTGWNEWVAQRFVKTADDDRWRRMAGRLLESGDSVFVDAYTQEFSRDIEPMIGGHGRNYYYQLVDGVRRFKGAAEPERLSNEEGIVVDGDPKDWSFGVVFRDFRGEVFERDHEGWAPGSVISQEGGYVDIRASFVACSIDRLFLGLDFCARGEESYVLALTLVLLDGGIGERTLKLEFEISGKEVTVRHLPDGWVSGDLEMVAAEGVLELSLARKLFGSTNCVGISWADRTRFASLEWRDWRGDDVPGWGFLFPVNMPPK